MNLIFSLFSTNGVVLLYSTWWNLALHFLPNYVTPILYHGNITANVIRQFTSWGRVTNSHAGHWNWKNMGLGKIKMNERLSPVMAGITGGKKHFCLKVQRCSEFHYMSKIPPVKYNYYYHFHFRLWILDPRNLKWHENKSCCLKHCFYTWELYWGVCLQHIEL